MDLDKENPKNHGLDADVEQCIATLNAFVHDGGLLAELTEEQRRALFAAAGRVSRPAKEEIRIRNKNIDLARRKKVRAKDRATRGTTGIREARVNPIFQAPLQITDGSHRERILESARNCYVCKAEFVTLHFFYDTMCPVCADLNYRKRFQTASLHGQVALITGSRLKIGYHATLMMLRAGAKVIATTRFPVDSALRFSQEKDFAQWKDRLEIHGLDLRHTPSVEIFCRYIEKNTPRLDILINNAAQTVRRPPGFYAHLMANERRALSDLPPQAAGLLGAFEVCKSQLNALCTSREDQGANLPVAWHEHGPGVGIRASAELSQIPYSYDSSIAAEEVFPSGRLDVDLQQVDLRTTNSWRMRLAEVPTPEMLEVQLVNSIAPFVLCSRLTPLMRRDFTGQKHIVNVTAMEGKFYRFKKPDRHPHTNMAKAALNMLTHTSASDLAKDGIYMNAVDTGWVTDEDPVLLAKHKEDHHDFQPPLDIVDGAARVCDPFFDGILTGKHWCGKFLKDYFPSDW
jgi:NAD(P)-dependent dehydrogenase (short-subunit alcohol dehydrogenase family)